KMVLGWVFSLPAVTWRNSNSASSILPASRRVSASACTSYREWHSFLSFPDSPNKRLIVWRASRRGDRTCLISSMAVSPPSVPGAEVSREHRSHQLGPIDRLYGVPAGVLDFLHEDDDPVAMRCHRQQRGVLDVRILRGAVS